jgi:hypothetical protein
MGRKKGSILVCCIMLICLHIVQYQMLTKMLQYSLALSAQIKFKIMITSLHLGMLLCYLPI